MLTQMCKLDMHFCEYTAHKYDNPLQTHLQHEVVVGKKSVCFLDIYNYKQRLNLSQTTKFRLFQNERQFQI